MRMGVWLIGARGSVAVTTMVGSAALRPGLIEPLRCVTELPALRSPALPALADLVFGGHDIASLSLEKKAHALVSAGVLPAPLVRAVTGELHEIETRLCPAPTGRNQHDTVRRVIADLDAFRERND